MENLKTYHLHIQGIVQGVGFRPFVYKIALEAGLTGWVNNSSDGVHIRLNFHSLTKAELFLKQIIDTAPPLSIITSYSISEVAFEKFNQFSIIHSDKLSEANLLFTPDFAMCDDCKQELYSPTNRRNNYPFITCTNCGPRYSIIKSLPYDRITTTMATFQMCPTCLEEYEAPLDRRYYSQTNSCPKCAINLSLWENGEITSHFTDLDYIVGEWNKGKIIAIKGIGGYLLTCDATNSEVIKKLRRLKNRPSKPFALMYHDIYELAEDVEIDIFEKIDLEGVVAPIVILKGKKDKMTPLATADIAPGLQQLGVMLPYTPLYDILLKKFQKPIIATSGNRSNSTIIFEDKTVLEALSPIADIILLNDRDIVTPQDDSIVKYSTLKYQKIILRRSRGMAPSYINPKIMVNDKTILSMGALLKSTFCLLHKKNIFISQYLGNTTHFEAEVNYKNTLAHFEHLLNPKLEYILVDKHPNYFATTFGKELAQNKNISLQEIQHHKAHFYALLGEHNLFQTGERILGVIWDGTGYGDDGQIWGGEFFEYQNQKTYRIGHLPYFNFILGDKMPKEPCISALSLAHHLEEGQELLRQKFTQQEWKIYQTILAQPDNLKTSSMGRLFDGMASLILGIDKQSYEGEAAMRLENAAHKYFRENGVSIFYSYLKEAELPENFTTFITRQILVDIQKGYDKHFLAAKCHITLAHYILNFANQHKFTTLAFSGGVFQNGWLVDLIILFMGDKFDLYFHKDLSPNDENISFGQLMYHLNNKEDE